jgi:RNA polymerase sigma factor (TIGR02999 family)
MGNMDITQLLCEWSEGSDAALSQLIPRVYARMKTLAEKAFSGEHCGHTLQPTALVHEAFGQLVKSEISWKDRKHFYALSARMMRRILVDHARAKYSERRGGRALHVTLDDSLAGHESALEVDLLALDTAMEALEQVDEKKARVIEMHYFGGLTYQELAQVTGYAESTIHVHIRTARAFLLSRLGAG